MQYNIHRNASYYQSSVISVAITPVGHCFLMALSITFITISSSLSEISHAIGWPEGEKTLIFKMWPYLYGTHPPPTA